MFDFLMNEGQKELRREARSFVKGVPNQLILDMDTEKITFPREFVENAGKSNLLGLRFKKEYGGRQLGWESEIIAIEEMGYLGTALACLYSMPSIVGEAIHKFGTEEQKEKYLIPTIRGEKVAAEGLTEPRGGSDFFGTTTIARKDGDAFIINGQKRFIVGAEGADYFLIYARTDENAPPHKGITAFLVDRTEDVRVEYTYGLMGTRGAGTGRVHFKNVRVPAENIIGKLNGGIEIFNQMMIPERMTSAAGALGMAKAALDVATRYSMNRKAFGHHIREFQGVNFKIAESITLYDAARSIVYTAARAIDANDDPRRVRRLVSEAKKFATESAYKIVDHSMQIMGGIGYTNVFPIEKMLRDVRLITIWTGTNEIMNLIIQSEYYKEFIKANEHGRNIEMDALEGDKAEEKVYE
ncbi:acyl-CoA dehydrogenase [Vulcanibacillus modesticaldus]|uniref:Acyl-CoA dehydrogenase n=1 Tax=Vulcanibacillus modesticaldus TaxID=337097 RepID=A0A1D2YW52_9BACI|nr:acyl-CoA dehydrogenase family protein [Vulcanibacillus modesticaldus]OEF99954.1 acyl-CoA dehydrogenase [Vulcanibacillus modesticaldus]